MSVPKLVKSVGVSKWCSLAEITVVSLGGVTHIVEVKTRKLRLLIHLRIHNILTVDVARSTTGTFSSMLFINANLLISFER